MPLQTTVFEVARQRGVPSDRALARAMKIDPGTICKVRQGKRSISPEFITGALRAFPDLTFADLFTVEPDTEEAPA